MRSEEIIVNVIFDADRGSVAVSSREAVCGSPLGALPTPVRAGYVFAGWYLNGAPVNESTVIASEEDVHLIARWTKAKGERQKRSMLKRQKLAVAVLACVTAFLIVALAVTNHIVAIYGLVDVYYGEDGSEYSEKYYIKKSDGAYALFDRDGEKMEKNSAGFFVAHSGNQYRINPDTGAASPYAVVDFDASSGEVLGYSDYIMMYPQIDQRQLYSLEVNNESGSFRFYRDQNGVLQLEGYEESFVAYDETKFTYLCVSCAYTLTKAKLDFTSEKSTAPRLEDGSIDYSAYGLSEADQPASFTVTAMLDNDDGDVLPDPEQSYTVYVGDALLSDNGYYVKMEGRSSVYILESHELGTDIGTVFQSVEDMVTPLITYPIPMVAQNMVSDFVLGRVDLEGKLDDKDFLNTALENMDLIAAFSYWDLEAREHTLYQSTPYISGMEGYDIHDTNADVVLNLFYDMKFVACRELGITKTLLKEYGFDKDVYYVSFGSPVLDEKNLVTGYIDNYLLISQKTENNTYYIASFFSDMIVEVDQYYLSFLDWHQNEWYQKTLFGQNIAHLTDLRIRIGEKSYDFRLDNSESDQSQQINASALKVFCEQYLDGKKDPHQLDYTITYSYISDAGVEEYDQISGVDNFRELCMDLYSFYIEGDFDATEKERFEAAHGMSVKDYIANEENCDAEIFYHLEDMAATMNTYTYTDKNGVVKKLHTKNNERAVMVRLYRYSERKALMTVEIIEDYEGGEPDSDPTKATGLFYVNYSYFMNTIAGDLEDVLNEYPIEPEGVGTPTIIR